MKRLKLPLLILGGLAALLLVGVVLAFTSGVQTWAVRRALAGQSGLKAEVGSVSVGLSAARIQNLRIVQDGLVIVAPEIAVDYTAMDYLKGRRITVARVAMRGVEIDARQPSTKQTPVTAEAALAPFAGVLNAIRLPGEVRLGSLDVEARVLLPDDRSATLALTGGGIAPGEYGTIKWTVSFADARKAAALATAEASGEIRIRTTADLRIDAVEIVGDAGATGPGLPKDRVKLEVALSQSAPTAGEKISVKIGLVRGTSVEPLFTTHVDYAAGQPKLAGTWNLAVRSEQLAAFLAGLGLPEVALSGEGNFTFDVATSAATAAGTLAGEVSQLEKLGAGLGKIGALRFRAAFDGGSGKDSAQLGKLELEITAADGRKLVTVATRQKLAFGFNDKRLTAERPGTELARVSLVGLPVAWAQPFLEPRVISGGDLSGVFVVVAELDGSRVKLDTLEPLTVRAVTLREGEKTLLDRVTLSLSPRVDYTAARIVAELEKISVATPDGDTLGGGLTAEYVTGAKPATAFKVKLEGRLVGLVKPYLPADAGPLALAVDAEGRHEGSALQLSRLKVQVDRAGGANLMGLEALQPLAVDLTAGKVSAPDGAKPAARLRWGDLPLAWAEPYVEKSKLVGTIAPAVIEVTLAGADAVGLRAIDRISARALGITLAGEEYLRGVDFSTDLNATWKAGTLTAEIGRLELRQGEAALLSAAVAGEFIPGKTPRANGRGTVAADFAALGQQPALAARVPLLRGAVEMKFDGAMGDGVTGNLAITAKNLVAREGALALGTMDLSVAAKLDANNAGTVRIPLVVTKDGRRSDVLLDGKVSVKPGAVSFEGRVTGEQVNVEDLQAFSALAAAPPPAQAAPAKGATEISPRPATTRAPAAPPASGVPVAVKPPGPQKDTSPAWAGFTGRVDLNLKAIRQGAGTTVKDLTGGIALREDRLTVENISGQLNGNPFKIATALTFDAKLPRPYALTGTMDIPGFDVGEFLRKADPATPAAVETKLTVNAKFNGTAANLPEFADRIMGQFDLKGTPGVLRALNRKAETTSAVTGLLGLAAGLAGQRGLAEGLAGASELASLLKDMPFDGITVRVERGADAAVVVQALEFISPAMRLTGTGRIDAKPGVPFAKSALRMDLQLAAKAELANGLNRARQLSGRQDDKGYYLMATPFTLGGTVEKPDSSDFWKNLTINTGAGFLR